MVCDMIKVIRNILATVALSLLLFSCTKENEAGMGYLKLKVEQDESLVVVGTKSESEPVFRVEIFNSEGKSIASCENHNDLATTPLSLRAGSYKVVASSGIAGADAAFDAPFYSGETDVEIIIGETATAEVVCTLSQVKVSVESDETITSAFKEVVVNVTNGADFSDKSKVLSFSLQEGTIGLSAVADDGVAGYFACTGTLKYSIDLTNNDGEKSEGEIFGEFKDVKVREHYIMTLTLSDGDEGGAVLPGIGLDGSTNDHEIDVDVNLNKKPKPSFTTNGFNLANMQYVSLGSTQNWQVFVTAKGGLRELELGHSSQQLANMGIPASFELVSIASSVASSVNGAGIVWDGVAEGTKAKITIDFSTLFSKLPVGEYAINMRALDKQNQEVFSTLLFKVIPAVETSTISADAWGKHAFLYGVYNTEQAPAGVGFEYRKEGEESWTKVTEGLSFDGVNYSVKITGLDPYTKYTYRTVSDKEPSNEMEFITLGAEQIYNMSFDAWYKNGKHWYANADLGENFWWDSGNEGANTLSEVNPTRPEESDIAVTGTGKKAAKLISSTAAGQFAAGSLYLGDFGSATLSPIGAKLNFGRPYSCKPLGLKGYYKYDPVLINKYKAPHTDKANTMDVCQIYIVLADWLAGYFEVNTGTSTFIDVANDPHIIGYGSLENNESTDGWVEFDIPIEYRNNRIPTTCVIVCSSSKYGDYFTGGVGSTLIVDEFEFTF